MIRKKGSLFRRIFFPLAISLAIGILILSGSLLFTYVKTYLEESLNNTHTAIGVLEEVFTNDFNEVSSSVKFVNPREFYLKECEEDVKAILDNQSLTIDADIFLLYDLECECETCNDPYHYDYLDSNYIKMLTCNCELCKGHLRDMDGNIIACMQCDICLSHQTDMYGNIVLCDCELCKAMEAFGQCPPCRSVYRCPCQRGCRKII